MGTRYPIHSILRSPPLRARIEGSSHVPRKPRVFVAGGTYHVHCRVARGERCGLKVKDSRWSLVGARAQQVG